MTKPIKAGDDLGNGLVAVPREPTKAMLDAGWMRWDEYFKSGEDYASQRGIWRAMIAALGDRRER